MADQTARVVASPGAAAQAPLAGRHAVVTGGGRGIGAAIAAELGRLGARLTLMGRSAATLEARGPAGHLTRGRRRPRPQPSRSARARRRGSRWGA